MPPLPWTSFKLAAIYLALGKKYQDSNALNIDIAMAFATDGTILGYGKSGFNLVSQSPILNLLQNIPPKAMRTMSKLPIALIACTYVPGERDLGMAQLAVYEKIKTIVYLNVDNNRSIEMYKRDSTKLSDPWNQGLVQDENINSYIDGPQNLNITTILKWINNSGLIKIRARKNKDTLTLIKAKQSYANSPEYNQPFNRTHTNLTLPTNFVLPNGFSREISTKRNMIFMYLAWAIVGESMGIRSIEGPYPGGHLIGSVLRGPRDEILAWGLNTNDEHWSLHGEVNLIQTYQKQTDGGILTGADNLSTRPILYSTLEPCYMCAGMYKQSGNFVYCYYGQKDPLIVDNALKISNQQILMRTRIGTVTTSAVASGGKMKESFQTTKVLDQAIDKLLLSSIDFYFDLVPKVIWPGRAHWTTQEQQNKTPESYIWENGLKLLHHINPGVLAKWRNTDRYYQGVID